MNCLIRTEVRSICVECAGHHPLAMTATPVITYTFIGISVFLYLIGFVSTGLNTSLAFTPLLSSAQPWRFLTTAFLHSGVFHIAFNMLALYWVGSAVEPILGRWRFASLYILSAVGGSLAVLIWVLFQPWTLVVTTVGASGAVFGLFGAIFVLQKSAGLDTRSILVLLGINLAYGFIASGISWQAHVGGLVTGLIVTWIFVRQLRPKAGVTAHAQERKAMWITCGLFCAEIAAIALTYRVLFEIQA